MGDRCYMRVTCRPADKERFEKLGFGVEEETSAKCDLTIDEANYANNGEMPEDIPYFGYHGEGCEYGAEDYCCDGDCLFYADNNKEGDLVVRWNAKEGKPFAIDVERVCGYLEALGRIKPLFHDDPLIAQMKQAEWLAAHPQSDKVK